MAAILSKGPAKHSLDSCIRVTSSYSGSDKVFMMVQYTAGLLTRMLPRLSQSQDMLAWVTSLGLLSRKLSELRTWMRLFGLLPILQWYRDLHTMPTPKSDTFTETSMTSRRLLRIEKLQAWSMLVYYPLEHYVLLATHKIVPEAKPATMAKLSLWSVRAWAAYVVLQLAHISEERRLLAAKQSWIQSCSDVHAAARMYRNSEAKAKALRTDAIINLAYLPMTIHWSLPQGLYRNEAWSAVFGVIAAWYQVKRCFK